MDDISVKELKRRLDADEPMTILDVREPHEYEMDHIAAENFPMAAIPPRISELEKYRDEELIVYCRSGGRSGQIKMYLQSQGFSKVRNLTGGMLAWKEQIDPDFNVS